MPRLPLTAGELARLRQIATVTRQEAPNISCLLCLKEFPPRTTWQKFCSTKCRNDYHTALRILEHRDPLASLKKDPLEDLDIPQ